MRIAVTYENGQVVESYGGGICQVSTTLYNALLYAELEIVERYPHSMLVNYVDPSRDAAIAGDTKDLKFKNNLDTPIYIEGGIDDSNQLYFAVYGKEVEREKVNESHYSKSDQVVKVGTKSDNANASAAVRAAIATQDYSKIMAAISQAGGA